MEREGRERVNKKVRGGWRERREEGRRGEERKECRRKEKDRGMKGRREQRRE